MRFVQSITFARRSASTFFGIFVPLGSSLGNGRDTQAQSSDQSDSRY